MGKLEAHAGKQTRLIFFCAASSKTNRLRCCASELARQPVPDTGDRPGTHELPAHKDPNSYPHIWEGEFATAHKGAYFTRELAALRAGRLCAVPADPLMTVHLPWDIGGTGAAADACSIWALQRVGRTIGVINYSETVGQPLAAHVAWMHTKGYKPGANVQLWLPHNGVQHNKVYQVTYQSELEKAGYDVTVVRNSGGGRNGSRAGCSPPASAMRD